LTAQELTLIQLNKEPGHAPGFLFFSRSGKATRRPFPYDRRHMGIEDRDWYREKRKRQMRHDRRWRAPWWLAEYVRLGALMGGLALLWWLYKRYM